jgi:hypothetical protein
MCAKFRGVQFSAVCSCVSLASVPGCGQAIAPCQAPNTALFLVKVCGIWTSAQRPCEGVQVVAPCRRLHFEDGSRALRCELLTRVLARVHDSRALCDSGFDCACLMCAHVLLRSPSVLLFRMLCVRVDRQCFNFVVHARLFAVDCIASSECLEGCVFRHCNWHTVASACISCGCGSQCNSAACVWCFCFCGADSAVQPCCILWNPSCMGAVGAKLHPLLVS